MAITRTPKQISIEFGDNQIERVWVEFEDTIVDPDHPEYLIPPVVVRAGITLAEMTPQETTALRDAIRDVVVPMFRRLRPLS